MEFYRRNWKVVAASWNDPEMSEGYEFPEYQKNPQECIWTFSGAVTFPLRVVGHTDTIRMDKMNKDFVLDSRRGIHYIWAYEGCFGLARFDDSDYLTFFSYWTDCERPWERAFMMKYVEIADAQMMITAYLHGNCKPYLKLSEASAGYTERYEEYDNHIMTGRFFPCEKISEQDIMSYLKANCDPDRAYLIDRETRCGRE